MLLSNCTAIKSCQSWSQAPPTNLSALLLYQLKHAVQNYTLREYKLIEVIKSFSRFFKFSVKNTKVMF